MRSQGFQRFVVIFVGVLLVLGFLVAIVTKDEKTLGMAFALAGVYAVYLTIFFRKEKERREKNPKEKKSPLLK